MPLRLSICPQFFAPSVAAERTAGSVPGTVVKACSGGQRCVHTALLRGLALLDWPRFPLQVGMPTTDRPRCIRVSPCAAHFTESATLAHRVLPRGFPPAIPSAGSPASRPELPSSLPLQLTFLVST